MIWFGMYLCVFNLLIKQIYFQLRNPDRSLFCAFLGLSHLNIVSCKITGSEVSRERRRVGRTGPVEGKLSFFLK
jgi:hypothetical protein